VRTKEQMHRRFSVAKKHLPKMIAASDEFRTQFVAKVLKHKLSDKTTLFGSIAEVVWRHDSRCSIKTETKGLFPSNHLLTGAKKQS